MGPVSFTLLLVAKLPTPNSRLHPLQRARQVREARESIALMALSRRNQLRVPRADGPRSVRITWLHGRGERVLDVDNAYGAMKPCLDGIVQAGWLVDDAPKWLTSYQVLQGRSDDGRPKIEVEVTG